MRHLPKSHMCSVANNLKTLLVFSVKRLSRKEALANLTTSTTNYYYLVPVVVVLVVLLAGT